MPAQVNIGPSCVLSKWFKFLVTPALPRPQPIAAKLPIRSSFCLIKIWDPTEDARPTTSARPALLALFMAFTVLLRVVDIWTADVEKIVAQAPVQLSQVFNRGSIIKPLFKPGVENFP